MAEMGNPPHSLIARVAAGVRRTGPSWDCNGAPRLSTSPIFAPEFYTPLNPSDS
jgi:hypothetical protein